MADSSRLGPWIRRFLLEHLIKERNLSRGTRQSYRDTLTLLIPFVARKVRRSIDAMEVCFFFIWRRVGAVPFRHGTSAWQLSTRWPASWPCTAPSTSLGVRKSASYLSRNARRHPAIIWKRLKSMPYSQPPTSRLRRGSAITFFSCSSTTQAHL
jgi:hypothetical protein